MKTLIIAIGLLVAVPFVQASDITFFTHSSDAQTFHDKSELRGIPHSGKRAFYVELVREMMLEGGMTPNISNIPFGRGKALVFEQEKTAFFGIARTPEREDKVKWVVPINTTDVYFYQLKSSPIGIESLDDAKSVNGIGVLRGGIHESILKSQGFQNIYSLNSHTQALSMLNMGRLSLIVGSGDFREFPAEKRRVSDLERTQVKLTEYQTYLAFSRDIPDATVEQWQRAFQQIVNNGKLEQLRRQYILPAAD